MRWLSLNFETKGLPELSMNDGGAKMSRYASLLAFMIVLSCAASPQQTGVAFQSLFAGASATGPQKPTLMIVSKGEELAQLQANLIPEHQRRAALAPLSASVLITAFRGAAGGSGFEVSIQSVAIERGRLHVVVLLKDPDPNGFGRPAIDHPYHTVEVSRSALGGTVPSSWVLVDAQGRTLAEK